MKTALFAAIMLVGILSSREATAGSNDGLWGRYAASADGVSVQTYEISVELKQGGDNLTVEFLLSWTPGVTCEFSAATPIAAIIVEETAAGSKLTVSIPFDDSFGNSGTVKLVILGDICAVTFELSKDPQTAAFRQYGAYALQRVVAAAARQKPTREKQGNGR